MQVLQRESSKNLDIINDYITAVQTEINLSIGYKTLTIEILTKLSQFHKDKPFANMKREDIIAYINSLRKPDVQDPMLSPRSPEKLNEIITNLTSIDASSARW